MCNFSGIWISYFWSHRIRPSRAVCSRVRIGYIGSHWFWSGFAFRHRLWCNYIWSNRIWSCHRIARWWSIQYRVQGSIGPNDIGSGAIQSGQIASGDIRKISDLASGSVTSGAIASGQVGQFAHGSGSVTSGAIGSGQVSHFAIGSGAITSGQIGSGAVTGSLGGGAFNIASGSIGPNDIGSGAIQSGQIASGDIGQFHQHLDQLLLEPSHRPKWAVCSRVRIGYIGSHWFWSGFAFRHRLWCNYIWSIGSGAVIGSLGGGATDHAPFVIASGTIGPNDIGSGAIQSGNIASGQVSHFVWIRCNHQWSNRIWSCHRIARWWSFRHCVRRSLGPNDLG